MKTIENIINKFIYILVCIILFNMICIKCYDNIIELETYMIVDNK
nr:MAG TPA: hypothetical protein [Caudoviricetes sp.]